MTYLTYLAVFTAGAGLMLVVVSISAKLKAPYIATCTRCTWSTAADSREDLDAATARHTAEHNTPGRDADLIATLRTVLAQRDERVSQLLHAMPYLPPDMQEAVSGNVRPEHPNPNLEATLANIAEQSGLLRVDRGEV